MTEREVETFSGREPTGKTPEGAMLIQETNQWRYQRESGALVTGVSHGGGTMHRMLSRREMSMVMDCPPCGRPICGAMTTTSPTRYGLASRITVRRAGKPTISTVG